MSNLELPSEILMKSQAKPKSLGDLPIDVLRGITEYLTTPEKFALRTTSRAFCGLIGPILAGCEWLYVSIDFSYGSIGFRTRGHSKIHFYHYVERDAVDISYDGKKRDLETTGNLEESMFDDIRRLLENPNSRLEKLTLSLNFKKFPRHELCFFLLLEPVLKSQKNIKKVDIGAEKSSHFQFVLSHLKSGTLEDIEMSNLWAGSSKKVSLVEIFKLKQWKEAKRVDTSVLNAHVPMEEANHLEEFQGKVENLRPADVVKIKNHFLRSETMKSLKIFHDGTLDKRKTLRLLDTSREKFSIRSKCYDSKELVEFGSFHPLELKRRNSE